MPIKLSHETFGTGEPLLILHGLFGSKRNWFSVARELARFSRVIAVDLRNHGNSDWATDMRFGEMAGDVIHLLDALGIGETSILGHSLGGKVAMLCALDHPERIRRVLVLDIAPVRYDTEFTGYIEAMQALPLANLANRADAEQRLAAAVPEFRVRQFLLHNLVRSRDGFRWRINLDAIADNLDALCDFPAIKPSLKYEGPARFIAGGRSNYLQPTHMPLIRRLFPVARLETIEDAGHWVHADRPQAVIENVRAEISGQYP